MPTGVSSQIIRVSTGYLNTVNDAIPGMTTSSGTGQSSYAGQLGAKAYFGPDEVRWKTNQLYGGVYQYVRFRSGATASPARGLIAFWDTSVSEDLYQVTNDETDALGVNNWAGIVLNAVTKGNYGFIQIGGRVAVLFRTVITAANPAAGDPVYCAGAGAGVDVATADVVRSAQNATLAQVAQMDQRALGTAEGVPVGAAISIIRLRPIALTEV